MNRCKCVYEKEVCPPDLGAVLKLREVSEMFPVVCDNSWELH